ncbi:MAG: HAD family hydrolase [Anaerolineales bacterium]|nr:HAD family hydrolase [Anaerolineales bacterium]
MQKPYLLFDAGGTLVFPDFNYLSQTALDLGLQVCPEQLFAAHNQLIYTLDEDTHQRGHLADPFPDGYPQHLFKNQPVEAQAFAAMMAVFDRRSQVKSLWTSTFPWVRTALQTLKDWGYAMSVISNSDGRANQILLDLGLRAYFDQVFDSHILGVSKPDRRIFEIALAHLDLQPAQALYVGDVFYIDVWGANQAGLGCIHLDPDGLYTGWPGAHLPSVAHLPDLLQQQGPAALDFFPTSGLTITF